MPSQDTVAFGLNYWKEHRYWAAEVMSNEVPSDVKVKCVFSTPRTAVSLLQGNSPIFDEFSFSSQPGLLNVRI